MTPTPSNAVPPTGGGISMVPTSPARTSYARPGRGGRSRDLWLQQRLAERRSAPVQVPPPPAQLPPVADGIYEFVMTAFTGAQQTRDDGDPCAAGRNLDSEFGPAQRSTRGDPVNFTYTVTNPGSAPLTDIQIGSALPDGVDYLSANSQGTVNPATGHVEWAIDGGLAPGSVNSAVGVGHDCQPWRMDESRVHRGTRRDWQ